MRKILCLLTVVLGLSWAVAQTGGASGSSDTQAGSEKGSKKTMKSDKKAGGETTLTGCLSGPNDEGAYVLQHGAKKVEVGGNDDLSKHVGHTVKLHGMWAKSGSEIGEKEGASEKAEAKEGKEEKGERHFKVSSIDHVAEGCKGAAGGEGHHHKKGSSDTSQPSTPPK